jgi:hypothetical protein
MSGGLKERGWGGQRRGAGRKPLSDEEKRRRWEEGRPPVDPGLLEAARMVMEGESSFVSFRDALAEPERGQESFAVEDAPPVTEPVPVVRDYPLPDGFTFIYDDEGAETLPARNSSSAANNSSAGANPDSQLDYVLQSHTPAPSRSYLEELIMQDITDWQRRS